MREKDLAVLAYDEDVEIEEVPVLEGFISLDRDGLEALRQSYGLAMTLADIEHVQKYFENEEKTPQRTTANQRCTYIILHKYYTRVSHPIDSHYRYWR